MSLFLLKKKDGEVAGNEDEEKNEDLMVWEYFSTFKPTNIWLFANWQR